MASKKKPRTTAGVKRTPSNLRNFEKETLDQKERMKLGLESAKLRLDADNREDRLRASGSAERKRIKELRAQAREKEQENVNGYRLVPAANLFSDKAKKNRGEETNEEKDSKNKPAGVKAEVAAAAAN